MSGFKSRFMVMCCVALMAAASAAVHADDAAGAAQDAPLAASTQTTLAQADTDTQAVSARTDAPMMAADAASDAVPVPAIQTPAIDAGHVLPGQNEPDVPETSLAGQMLPQDLSPWGMYQGADIVVKAVMIGLAFASLVTWTILLVKGLELLRAMRRSRRLRHTLKRAGSLQDVTQPGFDKLDEVALVQHELRLSDALMQDAEGIKERVSSNLDDLMLERSRRMTTGVGILATIGNTAPFVGLFGTVWGIMNSFIGISQSNTTNLAVVAPGIAEALLATALGLVAAIPAVIFYNFFVRRINVYKGSLGDISGALLRLLSRDLSRHKLGLLQSVEH